MSGGSKKKSILAITLILFFLVLAFAGPFILKDKKGRPFMSFNKIKVTAALKIDNFLSLFKKKPKMPQEAETKKIEEEKYVPYANRDFIEMYKYRDEKGVLHFTDQKPKGIEYETMYMPVSTAKNEKKDGFFKNLLPDKKKKEKKKPSEEKNDKDLFSEAKKMMKTATDHYKKAPQALNDAKELKKQVEEANKKREKMMDEM